jgi:peptidoglycan-associated lipoprotein
MLLKSLKNILLVFSIGLLITACSTSAKKAGVPIKGDGAGDAYSGSDTVKFLATGVADRVFFATNKSTLTTAAKQTLSKQAAYIKSSKIVVLIEGHADERGTREYNLALGERRANAVRDYLMSLGVKAGDVSVISYGKERPVNSESSKLAWSQNRRAVTVKNK